MDSDSVVAIRQRLQALSGRLELEPDDHEAQVQAGALAYENARADGLCHEGAWECALEAMRALVAETRPPW